jgi:hypothetical protein
MMTEQSAVTAVPWTWTRRARRGLPDVDVERQVSARIRRAAGDLTRR